MTFPAMLSRFAAALIWACFCAAPGAAAAECTPRCDYNHFYGPYDFTYIRPGFYAYPVCDARGECSPYLVYSEPVRRGRIVVRFPRRRLPR
jgi:hypothetical protein